MFIIVLLLKAREGRDMTLALKKGQLILSKGKDHMQYLSIIKLPIVYKLANIYD